MMCLREGPQADHTAASSALEPCGAVMLAEGVDMPHVAARALVQVSSATSTLMVLFMASSTVRVFLSASCLRRLWRVLHL